MNIHNLLYLIPNTRKERAKSLPQNWPRVNTQYPLNAVDTRYANTELANKEHVAP